MPYRVHILQTDSQTHKQIKKQTQAKEVTALAALVSLQSQYSVSRKKSIFYIGLTLNSHALLSFLASKITNVLENYE